MCNVFTNIYNEEALLEHIIHTKLKSGTSIFFIYNKLDHSSFTLIQIMTNKIALHGVLANIVKAIVVKKVKLLIFAHLATLRNPLKMS